MKIYRNGHRKMLITFEFGSQSSEGWMSTLWNSRGLMFKKSYKHFFSNLIRSRARRGLYFKITLPYLTIFLRGYDKNKKRSLRKYKLIINKGKEK